MIMNMQDFFSPTYEYYLDKVNYAHKTKSSDNTAYTLNCADNISTRIVEDSKLQVTISRSLEFSPDDLYSLSVSFVVVLTILDGKKDELLSIKELSSELAKGGQFFLADIISRMSSLISNITASYGQPPVITPPVIAVPAIIQ